MAKIIKLYRKKGDGIGSTDEDSKHFGNRKSLVDYVIKTAKETFKEFASNDAWPGIDLYSASIEQLKTRYQFLDKKIDQMRFEQIEFEKREGYKDLTFEKKINLLAMEESAIDMLLMHLCDDWA
jgi:hypothetical protein